MRASILQAIVGHRASPRYVVKIAAAIQIKPSLRFLIKEDYQNSLV